MKTNLLTHDFSTALATHSEPPCLSLYLPTHRHYPDNQQDPLRFRHLVQELEKSLEKEYSSDKIRSLLEPFEELGSDHDFWTHTLDGVALFGSPGLFQVYALQRPVPELAVVADITRVEVHLSDENSDKGGAHDKRCMMEARLEGHQPLAVTDDAETIDQAIYGAAEKLKHLLDHTLGRIDNR